MKRKARATRVARNEAVPAKRLARETNVFVTVEPGSDAPRENVVWQAGDAPIPGRGKRQWVKVEVRDQIIVRKGEREWTR